jgi:Na+/H+-dicarboxylate symporter
MMQTWSLINSIWQDFIVKVFPTRLFDQLQETRVIPTEFFAIVTIF